MEIKKIDIQEISNQELMISSFELKKWGTWRKATRCWVRGGFLFFFVIKKARENLIKKLNRVETICFNLAKNGSETVF